MKFGMGIRHVINLLGIGFLGTLCHTIMRYSESRFHIPCLGEHSKVQFRIYSTILCIGGWNVQSVGPAQQIV